MAKFECENISNVAFATLSGTTQIGSFLLTKTSKEGDITSQYQMRYCWHYHAKLWQWKRGSKPFSEILSALGQMAGDLLCYLGGFEAYLLAFYLYIVSYYCSKLFLQLLLIILKCWAYTNCYSNSVKFLSRFFVF